MELQKVLDRFKADLESYIREEVARQIAEQSGGTVAQSVATNNRMAEMPTSTADIQASLDELAALAQSSPREVNTDAVDALVSAYGSTAVPQVTSASSDNNIDYMAELQQLRQMPNRSVDSTAYDKLVSMNTQSSDTVVPQPPQPAPSAVTETPNVAESGQMSGIQSFLQKIRQRKNLSTN